MENKKLYINSTDIAVLFKKEFIPETTKLIYKPFKIIKGNLYDEECMFIDEFGNSYHHILEDFPGNCFGFRKSLLELKREYNTTDINIIKRKYLNEIKKYNYYAIATEEKTFMIKEDKKTQEITQFDDIDTQSVLALILSNEYGAIYETTEEIEEETEKEQTNIEKPNQTEEQVTINFNTHKLAQEIKNKVISQDEAIEKIVTTIWVNTRKKGIHNNILLIGNTGVGKTEIFRNISKLLNIPFYQTSIADTTKTGYRGRSVNDILVELVLACEKDVKKAENAIVFLDEFDKKAADNSEANLNEGVQQELLTILEDGIVTLNLGSDYIPEIIKLNTKNITFIGAGAFDGILKLREKKNIGFGDRSTEKLSNYKQVKNEDIVKFGFKPEIVGRFQTIVILNDLNKQDLITIMRKSKNNILENQIRLINESGVEVCITEDAINAIAENAIKKKTGARGLESAISDLFSKALYQISNPDNKYNYLEITKETVEDPSKYILTTRQKSKTRIKNIKRQI